MLYTRYLIIWMVKISEKSVSEISIFELPRLENCMSRLCPSPLGSPPKELWATSRVHWRQTAQSAESPPPPPKHPNRVENTYFVCALLGVDSLRGGLAEGNRILRKIFF